MNDSAYHRLREEHWRRKLTDAEETELRAYLTARPEAREDWEGDADLNLLLEQLPQAPLVASNFTSLVLQAVERDAATGARVAGKSIWIFVQRWLPRAAVASVVLGVGVVMYERHELKARAEMARNVAEITEIVSASNPELLKDFEPIRRLSDPEPKADVELLALY